MPRKVEEQTKDFLLQETQLPQSTRGRTSAYGKVLDAFVASTSPTVIVTMPNKEPSNMVVGLRNLINSKKIDGVKAVLREGKCFLTRE